MLPRTSQQNGRAERLNRTFGEISMCIRLNAELSNVFWVEVVNMAFFVLKGKFLIYIGERSSHYESALFCDT